VDSNRQKYSKLNGSNSVDWVRLGRLIWTRPERQLAISFIHTADWQLGKPFGSIEGDTAALLREERFEVVRRIAAEARERRVDAVLVAGDVFDSSTVSDQVVRRALEAMKPYNGPWVLLPGNHDPALAESPWKRIERIGRPANVLLALVREPIVLADGRLAVLPAPLSRKNEPEDVTEWMDAAATPADAIRVGLAHGSVSNRLPEGDARNEIADNRAATARLGYLALGDWHGTVEIAPNTWYSGTPEPDRFPRNEPGNILVVTVNRPDTNPTIEKVRVGRFQWCRREVLCGVSGDEDPALAIEAAIAEAAAQPDVTLLELVLSGTVSLAGRRRIEECLDAWQARLKHLRPDLGNLIDEPSPDDLDAIDRGGFVRAAVDRLKAKVDDPADADREIARTALRLLYLEHLESGR
jgi:DNA repair exonuclease SbcCD nuclease subunit